MANEVSRINRKIKAAMKRFIDHEDDTVFKTIARLAAERQKIIEKYSKDDRSKQPSSTT
jgi:esterase/lipase superfamily enzyme